MTSVNTALTRKLLVAALITSPLVAVNGVLAVYFQGRLSLGLALGFGLVVTLFIFSIWLINIGLVTKVKASKHWHLYALSFAVVIFFGYPVRLILQSIVTLDGDFAGLPTYPAINALVVNPIIWVIIELVRSGELKKQAEATIDKLRIENLEAQKQSLIRQIQPHFLFNALSTLKSLINENQKDAEDYTVRLSNFLRYSFASESTDLTTLDQELDFVQNYIELQSIRFENAFEYTIEIPEAVMQYRLPVLGLQTLVENIFKHNYFSEQKPLEFSIVYKEDGLTVWNQKVGLKLTERNETGLVNLNKRYELTNGSNISIIDNEEEFAVTIPLIVP